MNNIPWNTLELVIFDVDGTLYSQLKLRKKIFFALICYYIIRPLKYKDLIILYHFRKEREKRAGYQSEDLAYQQYKWCADVLNISVDKVKDVVDKWIFNFPNQYLPEAIYPGVRKFFSILEERKIIKAIYSDYPSKEKLQSMDLNVDLIASSTDQHVNAFKPLPKGLEYILTKLEIKNKKNCLFIGDREELDGECAKLAGIPFLLVNKKSADFYHMLSAQFNLGSKENEYEENTDI